MPASEPRFATVPTTGVEICHQTFGDPDHDPLLLIMGYTAQMISWPDGFVEALTDAGHHTIRFDNRDCGHSSKSEGPMPNIMSLLARTAVGHDVSADAPYALADMAADAIGLLDHLEIDRAHVVGASMGGMIVQELAIHHPDRIRSATSIMSSTGNSEVGTAHPEAMTALLAPPPPDREAAIEHGVRVNKVISGPLWDAETARRRTEAAFDRAFHPPGAAFQLAAIAASGDRTERLRSVDVPFLVIHGKQDRLIDVSGGHATAEAVPGADLLVLHDMGHDLPEPLWGQLAGAITGLTSRAEGRGAEAA